MVSSAKSKLAFSSILLALVLFVSPQSAFSKEIPRFTQNAHLFGEQNGKIRGLLKKESQTAFLWRGTVEKYAVVVFDGTKVFLDDCGLKNSKTLSSKTFTHSPSKLDNNYIILSHCTRPGDIRVIQPMNLNTSKRVLIEINNQNIKKALVYSIKGYLIKKDIVEEYYHPEDELKERWLQARNLEEKNRTQAAQIWAWISTHTKNRKTRLWAIEKFCMLQPYPATPVSPIEQKSLDGYTKQAESENPEDLPLDILAGKNMILAWPPKYTKNLVTKWRFLAELDICMEWLKVFTDCDQVKKRKKRMISRFRLDNGSTALHFNFRLHIPRKQMTYPPNHEPYSHEVSHGFITFPAITPTGQYNEGLTEVSRCAYWDFLGLTKTSHDFRLSCLKSLKNHISKGGNIRNSKGYGNAAAVYFILIDKFCRNKSKINWTNFSNLFKEARKTKVPKKTPIDQRWDFFKKVCEKTFGPNSKRVFNN